MLKSIIELVPFGRDESSSHIGVLYVCNAYLYDKTGEYVYIAGYFESPCHFNGFNQIERYKVFQFDRKKGLKALMQEVWSNFDQDCFSFDEEYIQTFWLEHALMMQERARKDGCYV